MIDEEDGREALRAELRDAEADRDEARDELRLAKQSIAALEKLREADQDARQAAEDAADAAEAEREESQQDADSERDRAKEYEAEADEARERLREYEAAVGDGTHLVDGEQPSKLHLAVHDFLRERLPGSDIDVPFCIVPTMYREALDRMIRDALP